MKVDITSIMYNENLLLAMWIESWLSVPFINKIYLVDGGSTDDSVKIAQSYDRVKVIVVPWQNDFARQRNIAIKTAKADWIMQPDIDEMPCGKIWNDIEPAINNINQIIIPYVKFYDWNKLWFFKNNVPTMKDSVIHMAANKSTTTIFSKKHLKGYSKPLHEMPMTSGEPSQMTIGAVTVELNNLANKFFIGHFDQTKHFEQARRNNSTVEFEMGLKRVRYRLISPATYSGKIYDQNWAHRALSELEHGNRSMIEELGKEQLKSFLSEHFVLNDYDAFRLNNDIVLEKLK